LPHPHGNGWRGAPAADETESGIHPTPAITGSLGVLRRAFENAGYTAEGLVRALGPEELAAAPSADFARLLRVTRATSPLNTLVRLFLLGVPVPAAEAQAALGREPFGAAIEAGLLNVSGEKVSGTVRILAFRGLLLACDLPGRGGREQVMGLTSSTVTLADSAVPRPSRMALDLGTGCGLLGMLAARHSECVAATDVSQRAVAFAAFNAAWNGISNFTASAGDCFEPVVGRRFDLILANPPFAISPSTALAFRDSGMAGDSFAEGLVRQAPEFLNEGGFAQLICDCASKPGRDWSQRVAGWVEGRGCDAWVLALERHAATEYARNWVRDTESGAPEEKARLYDWWLAHLDAEHVESVTTVLITLRRRSGRNRIRIEDAPEILGAFGEDIALGFELDDYLAAASDDDLLNTRFVLHPNARLEQELQAEGGRWRVTSARIRIARGLRWAGNVDGRISTLLAGCDGSRTAAELAARLASDAGVTPDRVLPACIGAIRQLLARGYLRPAGLSNRT
jgi:hypothetical protein